MGSESSRAVADAADARDARTWWASSGPISPSPSWSAACTKLSTLTTGGSSAHAHKPARNGNARGQQHSSGDLCVPKSGIWGVEEREEGSRGMVQQHGGIQSNIELLDFDFEKFCSVSLSNLNVYGCLVCGKYFQGRARSSHAVTHSVDAGHHVFINLHTEKVYCLPDGYQVSDPSLDDIKSVLNPRFTAAQIEQFDHSKQWARALDGTDYIPGMVGLNNIKDTGYVNVIIQSLMRVTPLRNFFLLPANYTPASHSPAAQPTALVRRFGELVRKVWHPRNFKGQVSPHEFLQAIMLASKKRFLIGQQSDPLDLLSWLLNTLHADLAKSAAAAAKAAGKKAHHISSIIQECFQGELEVIKEKFDGQTVTEVVRPHPARMRYRITRLPRYLILHMKRFKKNNFFIEKNPTLVNFPVKNLELKDYLPLEGVEGGGKLRSKYDLIANIVHDGKPGEGSYRAFVQRKAEEAWYEMQDLHVTETLPQMVALSEAYIQIYEQQQD
ncbi:unnamed protein product [Closterium sp. Yama58-4]|nr:unnamed protein product [Closterium sp. Yama58-4]